MRIPSSAIYQGLNYRREIAQTKLDEVITKLSSGKEISQGYENMTIFNNTLRLDQEEYTIKQSSSNAQDAKNFTDNADNAFTDMVKSLTTFKTKLLTAANGTHNTTSFQALATELEKLREHIISIANTSINGKFLFSGTALSTKPIDANGEYLGNSERIKTVLGANVEIPYNIPGTSIFLGEDSDKQRIITTNVRHYNISKFQKTPSEEVPITENDSIHDLTGNSGTNYFYITGTRSDGSTFKDKYAMDPNATVADLLKRIEKNYSFSVEASINAAGQIEIKDKLPGSSKIQFHMIAADQDVASIDDLAHNGANITEFMQSGYALQPIATFKAQLLNGGGLWPAIDTAGDKTLYELPAFTSIDDGATAVATDSLLELFGDAPASITVNGTHYQLGGLAPTDTYDDLRSAIESTLQTNVDPGITVSISAGKLVINDASQSIDTMQLSLTDATNPADTSLPLAIKLATSDGSSVTTATPLGLIFGNNSIPDKIDINGTVYTFSTTLTSTNTVDDLIDAIKSDATPIADGDYAVNLVGDKLIFNDTNHSDGNLLSSVSLGAPIYGRPDAMNKSLFSFNFELRNNTTRQYATTGDLLSDVLGRSSGTITFDLTGQTYSGGVANPTAGAPVTLTITPTSTVQDLLNSIQQTLDNHFNGTDVQMRALLVNGKIVITDDSIDYNGMMKTRGVVPEIQQHLLGFSINSDPGMFMRPASMTSEGTFFEKSGASIKGNVPQIVRADNSYATQATKLIEVAGTATLKGRTLQMQVTDINGQSHDPVTINFTSNGVTFTIDGKTYTVFNAYPQSLDESNSASDKEILRGKPTDPDEMTYQQLSDVLSMVLSGQLPADATAEGYNAALKKAQKYLSVGLNNKGQIVIQDLQTTPTRAQLAMTDTAYGDFSQTGLRQTSTLTLHANSSLVIDDPKITLFDQLQEAIDAVRNGQIRANSSTSLSLQRNRGVQNSIEVLDHLIDHVSRQQTENGAISNALQISYERNEVLIVNTAKIRADYLDADIARLSIELNQVTLNIQALMATISRVNNLSLVNFLK
ncbi:MAG: hypothetical protein K6347_00195 [Campylobacterales bacterium]